MTQLPPSRPLSPFMLGKYYRPQISSVLSLTHRATGVALSVGSILLVAWLWATAYSADQFLMWDQFFNSTIGTVLLIGWTFAFFYHLANGIRHLFWDAGRGFTIPNMTRSGIAVVLFAVAATAYTWCGILCSEA